MYESSASHQVDKLTKTQIFYTKLQFMKYMPINQCHLKVSKKVERKHNRKKKEIKKNFKKRDIMIAQIKLKDIYNKMSC